MQDAVALFRRHFNYPPVHVVRAPATVVLLGEAACYSEGLAVCAAVNKYVTIASAPRTDGKIELICTGRPDRELFWMSELKRNPQASWADPIKAILHHLRKRGANFTGFNAAVHSELSPMSDSSDLATLEVATALTIRQLHPFRLTETATTIPPKRTSKGELPPLDSTEKLCVSRLCQEAEQQFLGTRSGALPSICSLFGKAWHVVNVDLRFATVQHAPMIGEAVILCDAPVQDAPTTQVDNDLREVCDSAARKLGAKTLRSVELKFLEANKGKLTEREHECARHVIGEVQLAVFAERALEEEDHRQFGQFMFQSHESSRTELRNTRPEAELLVELARAHPGCLGACSKGTGSINLVAYHQAEKFMDYMSRGHDAQGGPKLQSVVCQIVDGAG
jgi:galactokinase